MKRFATALALGLVIGQGLVLSHSIAHDSQEATRDCEACKITTQPTPIVPAMIFVSILRNDSIHLPAEPRSTLIDCTLSAYSERGPPTLYFSG